MTKRHDVAATIIVGDNSQEQLERCITSLIPWVKGIFINSNGKEELDPWSKDLRNLIQENNTEVVVARFAWEDDFSIARQQSFSMVPRDKYDWYFWIDSDDTFIDGQNMQEMLNSLDSKTTGVFLRYDYLVNDDNEPLVQQWRERFLSTKEDWLWHYPVHETCHGRPGTQYARKGDVFIRHHRKDGAQSDATRIRNRRILVKARKQYPREARFVYYFGNELFAEANTMEESPERDAVAQDAITLYSQFISSTGFDDDAYMANCHMADCHRLLGEYNKAIDVDLQGIKLYPSWPTAYVGICKSCMAMNEWDKMYYWADIGINHAQHPQTTQVQEPQNVDFSPYILRGIALQELGRYDESIEDFLTAKEKQPNNEFILDKLEELRGLRKQALSVSQQHEELWKQQRKLLYGSSKERSICFITRPLFEPWHPNYFLQGRGSGGAELCVTHVATHFAKRGWRVAIFGTPGVWPGTDDFGIEWYPATEWDPKEQFKVLVSSRAPEIFDANLNVDIKILWMHDVNVGEEMYGHEWGNRVDKMDNIVGLTNWHINHMSMLYDIPLEKFSVIPNGVALARYDKWEQYEKHENHFVYSSSPDRGLDVIVRIWPQIKEIVPDAELHVYYGWEAIDKIISLNGDPNHPLVDFKFNLQTAIEEMGGEEMGIVWHDRVGQDELAEAQMNAGYWIYPTFFLETFCITAIESQAAGLIPLTSHLGALKETVGNQSLMLEGWPNNDNYKDRFLQMLRDTTSLSTNEKIILRHQGRRFAENFTWGNSFRIWDELIEKLGNGTH